MPQSERVRNIERFIQSEDLDEAEKIRNIKHALLIGENRSKEEVTASIFMVIAGVFLIIFMVAMEATYYETQEIGDWKMRAILALAAGCMAVGFTGNINIKFHWIQASGSLAVVLLFYFVNPMSNEHEKGNLGLVVDKQASFELFLFSSAYAEDEAAYQESPLIPPPDDEAPHVAAKSYNYKIVYPIGIKDLKNESFNIGNMIKDNGSHGDIKVYSKGSLFRAPINAVTYDHEYDISIKYNSLLETLDPSAVESITSFVESNYEDKAAAIMTEAGDTAGADIVIEVKSR